jgi:hypothetical protein
MYRFLIVLCSFLICTSNLYAETPSCADHQCIIVIDAGSTGSRAHLYAYDLDETQTPININEVWNKKIKPGFATLEPNYTTIEAYLSTLLSGAPTQNLPVYFYATAGMRLLPAVKQKMYYNQLQQWFSQQSQWKLIESKTITGNEEALFDWLSVNYHLGTLNSDQKESIGVMDMGGASVQVVFPIKNNEKLNKSSQVELDLYGKHINLYVHSFLGLGQTEMSHQFLNSAPCFSNNFPLPDGDSGQGNASTCEQEVSSLMNGVHGVNKTIQPVLSQNPVDSWYAIGGISNLADNKLFHFDHSKLTNESLLQQGDSQVCHQQWDDLNAQFPNDDYVYQYCLFPAYYYALMVDGYGLNPDQTVNYMAPNLNLDWTKGVVLHH